MPKQKHFVYKPNIFSYELFNFVSFCLVTTVNFHGETASINHPKNKTTLASFEFNPSAGDDVCDLLEMSNSEKDKITLFEHDAEIYRYIEVSKKWIKHGNGRMKIIDMGNPNQVQLLMCRDGKTDICCQFIDKDTQFNETQMSQAVLTWAGQSEYRAETEQWAIKFDDKDTCKMFYNIILISTAVLEKRTGETPIAGFIDELHEYSTTESPEDFKRRFVDAYKASTLQTFLHNLQVWNDINVSLSITTESQKRYYERICQSLNKTSTKPTDQLINLQ